MMFADLEIRHFRLTGETMRLVAILLTHKRLHTLKFILKEVQLSGCFEHIIISHDPSDSREIMVPDKFPSVSWNGVEVRNENDQPGIWRRTLIAAESDGDFFFMPDDDQLLTARQIRKLVAAGVQDPETATGYKGYSARTQESEHAFLENIYSHRELCQSRDWIVGNAPRVHTLTSSYFVPRAVVRRTLALYPYLFPRGQMRWHSGCDDLMRTAASRDFPRIVNLGRCLEFIDCCDESAFHRSVPSKSSFEISRSTLLTKIFCHLIPFKKLPPTQRKSPTTYIRISNDSLVAVPTSERRRKISAAIRSYQGAVDADRAATCV